jgi:hypothetical protein
MDSIDLNAIRMELGARPFAGTRGVGYTQDPTVPETLPGHTGVLGSVPPGFGCSCHRPQGHPKGMGALDNLLLIFFFVFCSGEGQWAILC